MSLRHLLARDVAREAKGKEAFLAGGVLLALFLLLDLFSFGDLSQTPRAAAVVLWSPLLFGAAALCGASLASDHDRGTMDLLRSAPVALVWHGVSRTIVNAGLLALLAALSLGAGSFLFAIPLGLPICALLALAVAGISMVATLAGGLAAAASSRSILLPLLMAPALAPLLQAGVSGSLDALSGAGWRSLQVPLLLMAAYDVAAAGVAWLLWPVVLEAN
ncbi:MAG: heme exporter protein CcmB [Thermoplasmatota archaeon]